MVRGAAVALAFAVAAATPGVPVVATPGGPASALRSSPAPTLSAVIVDADEARPIAGATATLLDHAGTAVDEATTGDDGRVELTASAPGLHVLFIEPPGYLSYSVTVHLAEDPATELRVEMPLRSLAAARTMGEAIRREAAFGAPLEELCGEELRPWEAGVLVGIVRDRSSMEPVPGAVVRLADPGADPSRASRVATASGAYWFCNVPAGAAGVITAADGFRPDTFTAAVRAGAVAWYDALLRRPRQ